MKHLYYLMSLMLCVQFAVAQSTVTGNVTDDLATEPQPILTGTIPSQFRMVPQSLQAL